MGQEVFENLYLTREPFGTMTVSIHAKIRTQHCGGSVSNWGEKGAIFNTDCIQVHLISSTRYSSVSSIKLRGSYGTH